MNILEAIVQLRDDLKTWVMNNLNALNAKIDEKTIPVDSELSSTSTNPVQNKVISEEIDTLKNLVGDVSVADQISTAIGSQPTFSGDYNDLTNAPNIVEDEMGNMMVADEGGHIIFKIDADGVHTTTLNADNILINNENIRDTIEGIAVSNEALTNLQNLVGDTSVATQIANAIEGFESFSGDYNDLKNKPNIEEDSEGNMTVADEQGHIIFKVDESGIHSTTLTLNGEDIVGKIDSHVNNEAIHITSEEKEKLSAIDSLKVDSELSSTSTNPVQNKVINAEINNLNVLVGDKPVADQIAAAVEDFESFNGDYNSLINAPIVSESNDTELSVVDGDGNIILQINETGIHSVGMSIKGTDVAGLIDSKIDAEFNDSTETWVFTLEDGSSVNKTVVVR